ncbi:MAG: tetratricopeptide repeat protein, partial [Kiloniellales bacterium]|nr:tetratricopeptide repeat protein [Kiloniellales bacterium]
RPNSAVSRALFLLKDYEGARSAAEAALSRAPHENEIHNNLANALKALDRKEEAEAAYRRAISLRPEDPMATANLADLLIASERHEEALKYFRVAAKLEPKMQKAWNGLSIVLRELGRTEEAISALEEALGHIPGDAILESALSQLLLDAGQLGRGWDLAEAGFACHLRRPDRHFTIPRWEGQPLSGQRLLVWREQGVGDEIRYASILADLKDLGGEIIFEAEPRLQSLFNRAYPWIDVRPEDQTKDHLRKDADFQIALASLNRFFRRDLKDIPRKPYLVPDPEEAEVWRERLVALGPAPRIGVCWRSGVLNRTREGERHYSPLAAWERLLRRNDVTWVSLQYGDAAPELESMRQKLDRLPATWDDLNQKDELDRVAALISQLYLIVSAPTAVSELAAFLGRPVIILAVGQAGRDPRTFAHPLPHPWHKSRTLLRSHEESWEAMLDRLEEIVLPELGIG